MVSNFSKFLLLMWKNMKITIRHPIVLALQILIPVVYCLILIVLRYKIHPSTTPENVSIKNLGGAEKFGITENATSVNDIEDFGVKVDLQNETAVYYTIFWKKNNGMVLQNEAEDKLQKVLSDILQIVMLASFLFYCITISKVVTVEKDLQLKEYMRIMGLYSWLQWLAWFCTFIFPLLITCALLTTVFKIVVRDNLAVLTHSNAGVLFLFLFLFSTSVITFSFMMSALSRNASYSTKISVLMWFISYIPFPVTANGSITFNFWIKAAMCLLSNTAMAFGLSYIQDLEFTKVGVQWSNLFDSVDKNMSMGDVLIMLVVDTILYYLVALYVERVYPGVYGIPLPWYFLFTRSFWCEEKLHGGHVTPAIEHQFFEPPPEDAVKTVELRHLRKIFNRKVAVNGISLDMYRDEIMILLGHNGAGKSTTISMLTGMLKPTSGEILIGGDNLQRNTKLVQSRMGLCPQHNILFDDLTVHEHIVFYSGIKGAKFNQIIEVVRNIVNQLHLEDELNVKAINLSGGVKRQLSVGLAFCGNPSFVLLDEPSSGMDPTSMRQLWQLLHSMKANRTILVVTHDMNEADTLADRLTVISEGMVTCSGTPRFLKQRIAPGFRLNVVNAAKYQGKYIMDLVRRHIPQPNLEREVGKEMCIVLDEAHAASFTQMLKELEESYNNGRIEFYSISSMTIEDVFMRSGRDVTDTADLDDNDDEQIYDGRSSFASEYMRLHRGVNLYWCQVKAMLYKTFGHFRGNYKLILLVYIVVASFILLAKARNDDYVYVENNERKRENQQLVWLLKHPERLADGLKISEKIAKPDTKVFISFNVIEHKLNHTGKSLDEIYKTMKTVETRLSLLINLNISVFAGFAMLFASVSFVLFYVKERSSGFRFLQAVGGLKPIVYWIVAAFFDLIVFITISFVFLATMAICHQTYFKEWEELRDLIFVLVVFMLSVNPMTYLLSYLFEVPTTAYIWIFTFYVFFGVVCQIIDQIFKIFDIESILQLILMYHPCFAFVSSILIVGNQNFEQTICHKACETYSNLTADHTCLDDDWMCNHIEDCCYTVSHRYRLKGLGRPLGLMVLVGVICWVVIMLIDYNIFNAWILSVREIGKNYYKMLQRGETADESMEVREEKARIRRFGQSDMEDYQLVAKDLSKFYGRNLAVNQLCLAIEKFECFGVLGESGAGKTTAVRLLTGDLNKSYGNVWVDGYSLTHARSNVLKRIGYCPQFEGLMEDLTGHETLLIMSLIRGISSKQIQYTIHRLAQEFNFEKHLNKKVCQYSGGTKRKLSTAITLIGNTSIIFLDEPTTGIDPGARKNLWNVVNQARECRKTIFLTTQMVEESEALCTRLGIMMKGNLMCLGTQEYLKEKYLQGFMLKIKLKKEILMEGGNLMRVKNYLQIVFHDAELKEEHLETLTYFIPKTFFSLPHIFEKIYPAKEFLGIEDFTVQHSTMEQIFLFLNQ